MSIAILFSLTYTYTPNKSHTGAIPINPNVTNEPTRIPTTSPTLTPGSSLICNGSASGASSNFVGCGEVQGCDANAGGILITNATSSDACVSSCLAATVSSCLAASYDNTTGECFLLSNLTSVVPQGSAGQWITYLHTSQPSTIPLSTSCFATQTPTMTPTLAGGRRHRHIHRSRHLLSTQTQQEQQQRQPYHQPSSVARHGGSASYHPNSDYYRMMQASSSNATGCPGNASDQSTLVLLFLTPNSTSTTDTLNALDGK